MITKEIVDRVRSNFYLNTYEAKVWLALLAKGSANISEINNLSKVPRSRIYDVLQSLENKGFCVAKMGKPMKYIAMKPTVVVERLKKNIEDRAHERIKVLEKVPGTPEFRELEKLFLEKIEPSETNGTVIKGRAALHSTIREMVEDARERVILVTNREALEKKIRFLQPILQKKSKQGVKIILALANGTPEARVQQQGNGNGNVNGVVVNKKEKELDLSNLKIDLRKLGVNARFCITDSNVLMITTPHGNERDKDFGIKIESDYFANALAKMAFG